MALEVAVEKKLIKLGHLIMIMIALMFRGDLDKNTMRLVMDNLPGNAWKYDGTSEEGISEFGTTEVNGKPAYFVRNNGGGSDMADLYKLFTHSLRS